MVRNRGKKALYEVMSKARVKSEPSTKPVEHYQPAEPDQSAPAVQQQRVAGVPKSEAKWWRKPRIVQLNAGRIEFSMPYQIAVVMLLVFIFVIIAAYRLGQASYPAQLQAAASEPVQRATDNERITEQASSDIIRSSVPTEDTTAKAEKPEVAEPVKPTGNNVIILAQYHSLPDLAPVQAHFAEHGIELAIVPQSGKYFLQTKQLYDNPANPGTDGYKALQKIIEVGKEYKAPAGYETFAPNYFSDAYGKKIK